MSRQHRHAELGMALVAREMRRANDMQSVVQNAEHCVALEIDVMHVGAERKIVETDAKAKLPVPARKREEMALERRPLEARELLDEDGHGMRSETDMNCTAGPLLVTPAAAASMAQISMQARCLRRAGIR